MDGFNFEESNSSNRFSAENPEEKGMAGMLVKWGIAKTYKQGETMLLIFSLVLIAVSIYIFSQNLNF